MENKLNLLPEEKAKKHSEVFKKSVDTINDLITNIVMNFDYLKNVDELSRILESHISVDKQNEEIIIPVSEHDSFDIKIPKSEEGMILLTERLEKACIKMLTSSVSVESWANWRKEKESINKLAKLAHHISCKKDGIDDHILIDRIALYYLVNENMEMTKKTSLQDMIEIGQEIISNEKNPRSRRFLSRYSLDRSNSFVHTDLEQGKQDSQIKIDGDLPEAVKTTILEQRNVILSSLLDFKGCEALGLKAINVIEHDGQMLVNTDAWHKDKLVVLRAKVH